MPYRLSSAKESVVQSQIAAMVGSGIPVIWDLQDAHGQVKGARPPKPYITIGIPAVRDKSPVSELRYSSLDTYTHVEHKEATIRLTIFSNTDNHLGTLDTITTRLKFESTRAAFRVQGMAITEIFDIRDMSAYLSTQHEFRAQMEFFIRFAKETNEVIGEFQYVRVDYEYMDVDGSTAVEGTFYSPEPPPD